MDEPYYFSSTFLLNRNNFQQDQLSIDIQRNLESSTANDNSIVDLRNNQTNNISKNTEFLFMWKNYKSDNLLTNFIIELQFQPSNPLFIIADIKFIHPNGPKYDFNFTINHYFSSKNTKVGVQQKINLKYLEKLNFLQDNLLKITIVIKDINQFNQTIDSTSSRIHQLEQLFLEKKFSEIKESDYKWLVSRSSPIFLKQPSLLYLKGPISIVGDIDGEYDSLLAIFNKLKKPGESNYLFLGNYLSDENESQNVLALLLLYKILYPEKIFLLIGSQEQKKISKSGTNLNSMFLSTFQSLPFAAIVEQRFFCVNSGISPSISSMKDISNFQRPTNLTDLDPLSFLVTSKPDLTVPYYSINNSTVLYGRNAAMEFISKFGFDIIVRSNQKAQNESDYSFEAPILTLNSMKKDKKKFTVVTISYHFNSFNQKELLYSLVPIDCDPA